MKTAVKKAAKAKKGATLKDLNAARKDLTKAMDKLRDVRRKLPAETIGDYPFRDAKGKQVALDDLFGKHDTLIVVHHMGPSCAYCTLWADGYSGQTYFIESKTAFAVIAPDEPKILAQAARKRGWKFRIYSDKDGVFAKDMGFWGGPDSEFEGPWPGVSVLRRGKKGIERVASEPLGPRDLYCPAFQFFDLLPK